MYIYINMYKIGMYIYKANMYMYIYAKRDRNREREGRISQPQHC